MTEVQEASVSHEGRKETPFEVIYRHVTEAIPPYREVLRSDANDKFSELGRGAKIRLEQHLKQLISLEELLKRAKSREQFKQVVKGQKLLEREDNPRQTFTARLVPAMEGYLPKTPDKPQIQLSFHSNINALDPESISIAYYALGLTRPADEALAKIFGQATEQSVDINTVGVYIDPDTYKTNVLPGAGITFRWLRGEKEARVGGYVFMGFQPHTLEIIRSIPLADFAIMQGTVLRLSGTSLKKTPSSKL